MRNHKSQKAMKIRKDIENAPWQCYKLKKIMRVYEHMTNVIEQAFYDKQIKENERVELTELLSDFYTMWIDIRLNSVNDNDIEDCENYNDIFAHIYEG